MHPCQVKVEAVEDQQNPFLVKEEVEEALLLLVKEEVVEVQEEVQLLF